jgi:hypothetical protein
MYVLDAMIEEEHENGIIFCGRPKSHQPSIRYMTFVLVQKNAEKKSAYLCNEFKGKKKKDACPDY